MSIAQKNIVFVRASSSATRTRKCPLRPFCPLCPFNKKVLYCALMTFLVAHLSPAARIKYYITPDYEEVWEDGKLVETIRHYRHALRPGWGRRVEGRRNRC